MRGCGPILFVILAIVVVNLFQWLFHWVRGNFRTGRDPRPAPGAPRIESEIRGCSVSVRVDRDPELGLKYTRAVVDLRGKSPGTLKIAPPGWASRVTRMFGPQDIVIGERSFDDHFIIMANPESLAHRVFAPERRARMIASVRKIGRLWAPFVDLTRETLSVGVVAEIQSQRQLLDLVATAREFVEAILEAGPSTGILWLEEAAAPGGQCQVCGGEMTDRVVHCASCRTPHHEECWLYMGECSTYACQETAYLKEGRRVDSGSRARILRIEPVDEALARFQRRQRERGR